MIDGLSPALKKFQADPNLFFEKVLGCEPEPYQRKINQAIADNERVAVSACHDVGKSWTLARIVLWFGACFPYSKIITTAPTYNQVKNILWSELRSAYAKSKVPLGGRMNLTEWQVTPEGDWFAIGFTPRNELTGEEGQGTQSSFQGFHAPYILVVFDEATGIPPNVWTMAEGLLTSARVKFVAIANPTSRQARFFKCFQSPSWHKIKLSCFDSPNLLANGIATKEELFAEIEAVKNLPDSEAQTRLQSYKVVKSHLLSLKWVIQSAIEWGTDHPLFLSKVLGEFPLESDGTLIPFSAVESAQLRIYHPTASDRKIIGVDVARFGSDDSVLTALHGKQQVGRKKFSKLDTNAISGEVISFARELQGVDVIVIDETGLGAGVVDNLNAAKQEPHLRDLLGNTEIRGVQFGDGLESESDKAKFVNLKARMFRLLSDDLKASDGLALQDFSVYAEELPTIRYGYDRKGRMFIESKDDFKKRTGRKSPDDSDSLALANFGRYDEIGVGSFTTAENAGFARPFAAGLGGNKTW